MKFNKWTLALAAAGVVSLGSAARAEEAQHQVMTALSQTTLSGYVDTSAMWMIGTGSGPLPGRIYDGVGKVDGFNLNVVNITLQKAPDEGAWSAGYKAELLFGPDAAGYNPSAFGGGDVNIGDAYVALRAPVGNGLDFKIGSFGTVVGYEVFNAPNNPNYGRSYGWQLEPTQHTGILASYQLTESIGISGGVANTWNAGINARAARAGGTVAESEKTYLGSVVITAPESFGFLAGSTLYGGIVDGLAGGTQNTTSWYAGATLPTPVEGLALGVAYDYVEDLASATAAANNRAYALAGYISFQATEKMRVNGRVDYTNADDGIWTSRNGAHDELLGVTATLDYSLWANVLSRAEVRWDHSTNGEGVFNRGEKNAVTVAANIVYKF
ncbi:MAG: outer membrane beta-barrel protein [Verrucomicrobia bacterium]|nr:outer membrane beta-barrel protein [Verrucomicrobiota bacterium]